MAAHSGFAAWPRILFCHWIDGAGNRVAAVSAVGVGRNSAFDRPHGPREATRHGSPGAFGLRMVATVLIVDARETDRTLPISSRTILLVEDEPEIRDVVEFALSREGWRVITANDVVSAEAAWKRESPDAIILDLVLPRVSGFELLRTVRRSSRTPVLILSSRDDDEDVVAGLELGADDYVKKPFNPRELVARVRAVMRRASPDADAGSTTIRRGPLRVEVERHEAWWDETAVRLTVSEFAILTALASSPERVHSREALLRAIHGFDPATNERTIDAHIKEIRRKFRRAASDADPVETVPMIGYRIRSFS